MDIEEALAALVAALRSGASFETIMQREQVEESGEKKIVILRNKNFSQNNLKTRVKKCNCNSVSIVSIQKWLEKRCLSEYKKINAKKRSVIEKNIREVSENLMAAYTLSNTLGCAIAECVEATMSSYHAKRRAEDLRADVAAMPQATIKLLSALPALALVAGEFLGGHPVNMLITNSYGWVFLAIGLSCYGFGVLWIKTIIRSSRIAMLKAVSGV